MGKTWHHLAVLLLLGASASLVGQTQAATPAEAEKVVAKEFGPKFKVIPEYPPITLDFDGDKKPDLVVAVVAENPLATEVEFGYKVVDPYSASFGLSDPRITLLYNTEAKQQFMAVVMDFRSDKPKIKYVLVNVPFSRRLERGMIQTKKKILDTVQGVDDAGIRGAVYWDGKKFKWMAVGQDTVEFERADPPKSPK